MGRQPKLRQFEFKPDKFRELVVYIAERCQDDPMFGAVKLNKILYYADFSAFRELRAPITGATYRKMSEGPAPKELSQARESLIDSGRLRVEECSYFGHRQKRLVVQDEAQANTGLFAPGELRIVDEVIAFFWGKSAREVSDYSHREPGWSLAQEREAIPYQTAYLSGDPIDQDTEEHALKIAEELMATRT